MSSLDPIEGGFILDGFGQILDLLGSVSHGARRRPSGYSRDVGEQVSHASPKITEPGELVRGRDKAVVQRGDKGRQVNLAELGIRGLLGVNALGKVGKLPTKAHGICRAPLAVSVLVPVIRIS